MKQNKLICDGYIVYSATAWPGTGVKQTTKHGIINHQLFGIFSS
jgi:hypothetical protein